MKAFGIPWKAVQNEQGNWSVINADNKVIAMISHRVYDKDSENLARCIAAIPQLLAALSRVEKMNDQLVPASRFTGERRKKKFEQLEAMEAGVYHALGIALNRKTEE